MKDTSRARLVTLARKQTFLSAREVSEAGIHSQQITRLVADGTLERIARGHYRFADADVTEHHGLALAAAAAPSAVICLLSALSFHGIGTQLPAEVWLAVERGGRAPRVSHLRMRVVRFSGVAFHEGIELHAIEGQRVRVVQRRQNACRSFQGAQPGGSGRGARGAA